MTTRAKRIADNIRRELDELSQLQHDGDWVSAWTEGDAIATDQAASIAGCSAQTIRRVAAATAEAGRPIGRQVAKNIWLISRRRLFDWIEREGGLPERVKAEARAEKWKNGCTAPNILPD